MKQEMRKSCSIVHIAKVYKNEELLKSQSEEILYYHLFLPLYSILNLQLFVLAFLPANVLWLQGKFVAFH